MGDLPVIPHGWSVVYAGKADLGLAFSMLDGYEHFYAETLRGQVRAFQLRSDEAHAYFERAAKRAEGAPSTLPNLLRKFRLSLYAFHNALGHSELSVAELPSLGVPHVPAEVLDAQPELRRVYFARKGAEALLCLHRGHFEDAIELYEALLAESDDPTAERSTLCHVGLAAGLLNLGRTGEARRQLENAGFLAKLSSQALTTGRIAAFLAAIYDFLGDPAAARGWQSFITAMDCCEETKNVFYQRAQFMLSRSLQRQSLVLV